MSAPFTKFTSLYVVVARVGKRSSPWYAEGWQFHSVHETYQSAMRSVDGWNRQGCGAAGVVFSWSQCSGFEPVSVHGENLYPNDAINADRIIPRLAVEHYHEMLRNIAEQASGRELTWGSVIAPMDVAAAVAAVPLPLVCPACKVPCDAQEVTTTGMCRRCTALARGHVPEPHDIETGATREREKRADWEQVQREQLGP